MKVVMAFGDSLTYGADAENNSRHAYEDRWPTVLEQGLGGQARVIAEGLGGRTTVFDDFAADADRNGARVLPTLLGSHSPLDAVVIMLGTNDLKPFNLRQRAWCCARGEAAGRNHPLLSLQSRRGRAQGGDRFAAAGHRHRSCRSGPDVRRRH